MPELCWCYARISGSISEAPQAWRSAPGFQNIMKSNLVPWSYHLKSLQKSYIWSTNDAMQAKIIMRNIVCATTAPEIITSNIVLVYTNSILLCQTQCFFFFCYAGLRPGCFRHVTLARDNRPGGAHTERHLHCNDVISHTYSSSVRKHNARTNPCDAAPSPFEFYLIHKFF